VKRLQETHGTVFELIRHFLARMFDSELFSTQGQWRTVAIGAFAMLVPAGLLLFGNNDQLGSIAHPENAFRLRHLAGLASPEPFRAAALANELAMLTALFAITGLIALLEWQSLYPSRRDYLALAGLPIRSRQIFAARFAAVLLFSTGIVVTVNLLPALIVPLQLRNRWQQNPSYIANMAAQAVSSGLACFFVLFSMVALQGVLLNVLPGRVFARVSAYVQGALVAALGLAFLYTWFIKDWGRDALAKLPEFGWAPPVWFLGLQQQMAGTGDPLLAAFFTASAHRALIASAAVVVLALLMYLIGYGRYRSLLLESNIEVLTPPARRWSVARLLARGPRQEAIMQFLAQTLARSRLHRLMLLAYVGAAIAILLNSSLLAGSVLTRWPGWRAALEFVTLFWPLAFTAIVLPGFRHILSVPAELPANWIFQIAESQGRAAWMAAVERFIVVYAILPIYLLLSPVAIAVLGWPLASRTIALQLLVSLSMFEMLFYSWQQLPFTCSYVPGKRPLIAVFAGYLATLWVLIPALSRIIAAMSQFTELFLFTFAIFGAFWIWARRRRREGWGEAMLRYVDVPEGIQDLGIKEMTYGGTAALRRTASGDAGHADLENAPQRPDARLRSGGVDSTDVGGCTARGGGSAVSGAASVGTAGASRFGMGGFPEQPPREILPADGGGTQATGGGGGPLEPHGGGHRAHYGTRLTELRLRLRTLLKRRQLDRDIEEEMQFHLQLREQRFRAEGVPADEAQAAARRQFGNVTFVNEACRNLWTFAGPETLWRDMRFGARLLRRSPGFTAVAALTLALGIGATTAIYSMCDAVLWRPVPLPQLERLVMVLQALPGNPHLWQPAAAADIDDVRRNSRTLESLASWQSGMANLLDAGGEPVRVESAHVTANFFDVLGVRPALGRVFLPDEEQPGHDREVVLSDNCWRRRFAADPQITGRTIRLNDRNYTVVGVMPPQFAFPRPWYELWIPLALTPVERHSSRPPANFMDWLHGSHASIRIPTRTAALWHGRSTAI
jgi:hypothetical protein